LDFLVIPMQAGMTREKKKAGGFSGGDAAACPR
jgi:hypothetical protein